MYKRTDFEEIAPAGDFSIEDIEIFMKEIPLLKPEEIYLEIGVDRGKSLFVARQLAHKEVKVCGVDIKNNPNIPNTIFFQGNSKDIAKQFNLGKISILFIDGDHSYKGCFTDLISWYHHMKDNGIILMHDHDESSPGVLHAVAEFADTYGVKYYETYTTMGKKVGNGSSLAKLII